MKKLLFTQALLCLFTLPFFANAQAPSLGTAADFVLFSTTGAITNSGISQITGDVGTNTGAVTNFGNVNGIMQVPANGATAQASTDIQAAYLQIKSLPPTASPAPLLGNGQVLTPAVFHIAGDATLAGDLILDGQGNSAALFIFQLDGAFSANFGAKVKLINGTQACNVFWTTEGLADMAASTAFKGNLIAHNAAISLNTADTIEGRLFAIAGAITLDGVLARTPAGCGAIVPAGPAAPALGSAACFAIFSGNGPVTNSGITRATGDIGTNVGLTTGYDPLTVNGTIHPIPDLITVACKNDLLTAYDHLNLLPVDIKLLYPAQFGSGLVLTPHTYLMDAAAMLTGNVTLNGLGNPNAVFVIKINGELTTSTSSRVTLANGTQAKNVYWKVEGAVNISGNSVWNGTIISNNGAMSLATGDSLNGRFLTTDGAITTAASVVTVTDPCLFVAPLKWLYFRGKPADKNIMLNWAVSHETGNRYFTIEKSTDGSLFKQLVQISSVQGSTSAEQAYSYGDVNPAAVNYYRLSQTDLDGKKSFYSTIKVLSKQDAIKVIPYVEGGNIRINISGTEGKVLLRLTDMAGRTVYRTNVQLINSQALYNIPKPLQSGMYLVSVSSETAVHTGKIIIQ